MKLINLWYFSISLRERAAMALRLKCWKIQFAQAEARRRKSGGANGRAGRIVSLQNRLPNSGGFPVDPTELTPQSVFSAIEQPLRRATSVVGFEGLALDDALAFSNEYKHFSFFRQARAIARIACIHHGRPDVSVLELGCGGGDMRPFFHAFGIDEYIGVDVNPIAFAHSSHIRGYEGQFRLLNLQQEIDFATTFDVVCSFEVLEHIREDELDHTIRTIRTHMGPRSIFLGTASLQDELDVHITVKPREFWVERFGRHDLAPHPEHTHFETLLARNHPFNWHRGNTNVFAFVPADAAKEGK